MNVRIRHQRDSRFYLAFLVFFWAAVGVGPAVFAQWAGRTAHTSVVFDDKIWLMGGVASLRMNDVWASRDGAVWVEATASAGWAGRQGLDAPSTAPSSEMATSVVAISIERRPDGIGRSG